jgi:hypothetical protein
MGRETTSAGHSKLEGNRAFRMKSGQVHILSTKGLVVFIGVNALQGGRSLTLVRAAGRLKRSRSGLSRREKSPHNGGS